MFSYSQLFLCINSVFLVAFLLVIDACPQAIAPIWVGVSWAWCAPTVWLYAVSSVFEFTLVIRVWNTISFDIYKEVLAIFLFVIVLYTGTRLVHLALILAIILIARNPRPVFIFFQSLPIDTDTMPIF